MKAKLALSLFLCALVFLGLASQAGAANINIDSSQLRQRIDGLGGNYPFGYSSNFGNPAVVTYTLDNLKPSHARLFFSSKDFEPSNDNSDASSFNWGGFTDSGLPHSQFLLLQDLKNRGLGKEQIVLSPWKMPSWMTVDTPQLFIPSDKYDEAIELIAATLVRARDTYGVEIKYIQFNEPNNDGWDVYFSPTELCTFIKRAAPRFSALGLDVKWLAADTWSAGTLVNYARPMLEDSTCRQHLGPVDFHSWWDTGDNSVLTGVYNLASQYGLPVWVEESGTGALDTDDRTTWSYAFGLAQMYQRLLRYARASALSYWVYGSWSTWDPLSPTTLAPYPSFYVLKQMAEDLPSGSYVIESSSSDSAVWVIAAMNPATGHFSVQMINTASTAKAADISGLPSSTFTLIRTSSSENAVNLGNYQAGGGALSVSLPGQSITSLRSETCSSCPADCGSCAGMPDLVVTGVSWSPQNPIPGENVLFSATVRNQGTASTPSGTIHGVLFGVDSSTYIWSGSYTSSIAPGAYATLTANDGPSGTPYWTATEGSHSVSAHVDDVNRIAESNESNNIFQTSLPVHTGSPQTCSQLAGPSWDCCVSGETCIGNSYREASDCPETCCSQACTTAGTGPMAWWKLDEGSGPSASDSSGNGNTGTLSGPLWTAGRMGGSLDFDGTDDYVSVVGSPVLDMTDAITIAAWVKSDGWANTEANFIAAKNDYSGGERRNYFLSVSTLGQLRFGFDNLGVSGTAQHGSLSTGTWYHVAATYDRSNIILYINGTEAGRTAENDAMSPNSNRLSIGRVIRDSASDYGEWDGLIDDVRIYSRALSAQEILSLYQAGSSIHKSDTDQDGCVSGTELSDFINLWYLDSSNPTLKELMEAIGFWKRGCS